MSKETKVKLIAPLTLITVALMCLTYVNTTYRIVALIGVILFFGKLFLFDLPKIDARNAAKRKAELAE